MRADASARLQGWRSLAILTVLLAGAAAGCRTAGGGTSDPRPAIQPPSTRTEAAEIAGLPDGPGKALVTERCLVCHSAGLITQQRKDAAAWDRTVSQMRTWGAPLSDDEQKALVAYLAEHFAARP